MPDCPKREAYYKLDRLVCNVCIVNMSRKTATVGVRIPEATCEVIRQISSSRGRTPSDLLAEYAEEMARMHRFCHIEFRDTPLGRMAYVTGTRTAVWLNL